MQYVSISDPYRQALLQEAGEATDNLRKKFIKTSLSSHASPVLFVRKPGAGLKFCLDYRKVNAITKKNKYSMSLIDDIIDMVAGTKYITVLNI